MIEHIIDRLWLGLHGSMTELLATLFVCVLGIAVVVALLQLLAMAVSAVFDRS